MVRNLNYGLICLLFSVLAACGFHLRGESSSNYKFPFKKVYVECNGVVICQNLKTAITTEALATLESSPAKANVTIKLFNEQTSRDPQGYNSLGRISAYILTYQTQAQLWQKSEQIGGDMDISQHLVMQYNDSTILADTTEEENFWDQLHQMATNQLIHRIVYFKPFKLNHNDTESR